MRHSWKVLMALTLSIGIFLVPGAVHGDAVDGTFTIRLTGQVSSSQVKNTDGQGNMTIAVSEQLNTNTGEYPAVLLQLTLTEIVAKTQRGRLSGTATISDLSGQTSLFNARVNGVIAANGVVTYTLTNTQAATGSGGTLVWQGNYAATARGALNGAAKGTLILPNGVPSSVARTVWPQATTNTSTTNSDDPSLWYLTRGAALAAYVVLVATTALGIGISTQAFDSVTQRWRVLDLHVVLTLLLVALIALHLVTLFFDPFLPFTLLSLFVPFATTYRPLYVASGVLGLYSLAIVTLSSWVRGRMPYRVWRGLHYFSALTFVTVTLHGIFAGTDTQTPWMIAVYIFSGFSIVALLLLRIIQVAAKRA